MSVIAQKKNKVIIILGPTAVGKTELSLKLAQHFNSEIISGDSMLIYKDFNIGTAKPTANELSSIKHHLINILDPHETYNVTEFCQQADTLITSLNEQHKLPIIAGGTGLYIKSLVEGYKFNAAPENPVYRSYLENLAQEHGRQYVLNMLTKVDPQTAKRLHINNFRRIIRALEVYEYNKDTISQETSLQNGELLYNAVIIGLNRNRQNLYERINKRVDIMIDDGWINEVQELLDNGIDASCQAMQAIGYRQLTAYLQKKISLATAIEDIKKTTRHFAKRQLTWYRKMPYINWFSVDELGNEELLLQVETLINEKFVLN